MRKHDEWKNLNIIEDLTNRFSTLYEYEDGSRFYIEPIFYSYLSSCFIQYPDKKQIILDEMERVVRKNKLVIFTGMDEEYEDEPITKNEDAIVLTIYDILNTLHIYVDNKSRGSDYGDWSGPHFVD